MGACFEAAGGAFFEAAGGGVCFLPVAVVCAESTESAESAKGREIKESCASRGIGVHLKKTVVGNRKKDRLGYFEQFHRSQIQSTLYH